MPGKLAREIKNWRKLGRPLQMTSPMNGLGRVLTNDETDLIIAALSTHDANAGDLVKRLRGRARMARSEGTATALGDAVHFEEAADALATPGTFRDGVEAAAKHLNKLASHFKRKANEVAGVEKTIRYRAVETELRASAKAIRALSPTPPADAHADLIAALKNAIESLDHDGPKAAAASLNTHGRAAIAKAEQVRS